MIRRRFLNPGGNIMEIFIVLIIVCILFNVAALCWGVDSRDDINSREWIRRQDWSGFY